VEVTLYDDTGHPIAYIAEGNEQSIYLWSGHAVAYLVEENVYGWNGQHLGWFVSGVLHDLQGFRVGSIGAKCLYGFYGEPGKYGKYGQYAKYGRYAAYGRPGFSSSYGAQTLEDFLKSGAVVGV
jgi:hypothetical protein